MSKNPKNLITAIHILKTQIMVQGIWFDSDESFREWLSAEYPAKWFTTPDRPSTKDLTPNGLRHCFFTLKAMAEGNPLPPAFVKPTPKMHSYMNHLFTDLGYSDSDRIQFIKKQTGFYRSEDMLSYDNTRKVINGLEAIKKTRTKGENA